MLFPAGNEGGGGVWRVLKGFKQRMAFSGHRAALWREGDHKDRGTLGGGGEGMTNSFI